MKRIMILLIAIALLLLATYAVAFNLYGYTVTDQPTCDKRIRVMLKDADIIEQPAKFDTFYHVDETGLNINPLISDMRANTDCIYYYDVLPQCENTPLYCMKSGALIYNGKNEAVLTAYGVIVDGTL